MQAQNKIHPNKKDYCGPELQQLMRLALCLFKRAQQGWHMAPQAQVGEKRLSGQTGGGGEYEVVRTLHPQAKG